MRRSAAVDRRRDAAPDAERDFPGAGAGDDAMLRHVLFAGSIWFAADLIALAVPLAVLVAAGWRPDRLDGIAGPLWWVGAGIAVSALGCLAWAGCPAVVGDLRKAAAQKSWTVRIGVALAMVGLVATSVALLIG